MRSLLCMMVAIGIGALPLAAVQIEWTWDEAQAVRAPDASVDGGAVGPFVTPGRTERESAALSAFDSYGLVWAWLLNLNLDATAPGVVFIFR